MTNLEKIKEKITSHQKEFDSKEVCGFLFLEDGEIDCCPAKNTTLAENIFIIDSCEYFERKIAHQICGVYHTHLESDSEPSEFDVVSSEHSCLPFLIYSIKDDDFSLFKPDFLDCSEEGVLILEGILK